MDHGIGKTSHHRPMLRILEISQKSGQIYTLFYVFVGVHCNVKTTKSTSFEIKRHDSGQWPLTSTVSVNKPQSFTFYEGKLAKLYL